MPSGCRAWGASWMLSPAAPTSCACRLINRALTAASVRNSAVSTTPTCGLPLRPIPLRHLNTGWRFIPVTDQRISATELHAGLARIWDNPPGWRTLSAVNHTAVGQRFIVTGVVFFLIGGLPALILRTQLALPNQVIVSAETDNQVFTMQGTVMMFLFAIPVLAGLAMYLIPKMIGARDLAVPRLSA